MVKEETGEPFQNNKQISVMKFSHYFRKVNFAIIYGSLVRLILTALILIHYILQIVSVVFGVQMKVYFSQIVL